MNIPRLVHAFDQLGAYTRPLSGFLREFYENLVDQGFTEAQAYTMVVNFMYPLAQEVWNTDD